MQESIRQFYGTNLTLNLTVTLLLPPHHNKPSFLHNLFSPQLLKN